MKAIEYSNNELRYNSDYPVPAPAAGEALVRVSLAGICATDLEIVKGYMGFEGVPGHEFVGIVESADDETLVGRRVVGEINCACGECDYCGVGLERHCPGRSVLGILGRNGAFAEFLVIPESNLHPIPDSISDAEAVFIEPLAAAFAIPGQIDIDRIDSVCVVGDGRLGLLVAQVLALHTSSLLAVGRHTEKLGLLANKGIATSTSPPVDERFDIVVDCTGAIGGVEEAMALARPGGTIVLKTTVAGKRLLDLNQLVIDELTLVGSRCGAFPPAIEALRKGRVTVKSLVTKAFSLDDGVEAFACAQEGEALKVLLRP